MSAALPPLSEVASTGESVARIAVALAAFNGEKFIRAQLDSILAQQGVDVIVFVSIDPSSDATESIVSEIARADSRVHLLPHAGRFGGAAPNFLRLLREIELDDFDYLSFADQDDLWYPDKLSRAVQCMRSSGAAAYSSNVVAFWETGREVLLDKAQPQRHWDYLFEAAGPGCTYVFSRELAMALRACTIRHRAALEPLGYHDWLAYAFARANGFTWVIDSQPGMAYRQHAENQIGANTGWKSFVQRVKRVRSGHAFAQAVLIADVVGASDAEPILLLQRGRLAQLRLAMLAPQCRRSTRDRLYFACMCLGMALLPKRLQS